MITFVKLLPFSDIAQMKSIEQVPQLWVEIPVFGKILRSDLSTHPPVSFLMELCPNIFILPKIIN